MPPGLLPPANAGIPRGWAAFGGLLWPYAIRVDYFLCYPITAIKKGYLYFSCSLQVRWTQGADEDQVAMRVYGTRVIPFADL